jgi:hypothetical protein
VPLVDGPPVATCGNSAEYCPATGRRGVRSTNLPKGGHNLRKRRGTTSVLLCGLCVLTFLVGAEADDQAASKPVLRAWQAWQERHTLPRPENDKAEEALVGGLLSLQSFAPSRDALLLRRPRSTVGQPPNRVKAVHRTRLTTEIEPL